jgi:hypothetical protein
MPARPAARPLADFRRRLPDKASVRAAVVRTFQSGRPEWFARLYIGLLAVLVLLLFWVVLAQDRWPSTPAANTSVGAQPGPLPNGRPAFVTASVLNCRSAPAAEASQVERLVRGDRVLVLGRDREWASLSHEDRQCWALLRYLAFDQPI